MKCRVISSKKPCPQIDSAMFVLWELHNSEPDGVGEEGVRLGRGWKVTSRELKTGLSR